jgi:hypothetical protein
VVKRIGNKIIRNNLKIKCLERKVKEQENVSTLKKHGCCRFPAHIYKKNIEEECHEQVANDKFRKMLQRTEKKKWMETEKTKLQEG